MYIFVSGWSKEEHVPEAFGIWRYEFEPDTGRLMQEKLVDNSRRWGVLCVDRRRNVLYALDESLDSDTKGVGGGGGIGVFQLGPGGECRQIGYTATFCPYPAFLTLDQTGEYLIVANHASNSYVTKLEKDETEGYYPCVEFDDSLVEHFSINPDGTIHQLVDAVKHLGRGPGRRQIVSHPHCAAMSPSGNLFAVCDTGNDGIYRYQIDREHNKLTATGDPYQTAPGTMPRYCAFHPSLPYFYYNCEGALNVFAARYGENGELNQIGAFQAVDSKANPRNSETWVQQGFCVHPSGRYLYDVINGAEAVAVFRINQQDGSLELIQNQTVGYGWARGAVLSPDGRYLLVMCCMGNQIVPYRIEEDGTLTPTGNLMGQYAAADAVFWNYAAENSTM